ncbi:MAG: hypothetical protein HY567_02035 [Candidatus Kerfeldbacteria bacterium]|nr:hypothetical protein [Candidatus Kerfeldbacteria bacterium]
MAVKASNPKQAIKEQERRFREETRRLRQEPATGSEGYTNVYLKEPVEPEEEQPADDQASGQVSTARFPRRQSFRPASVEEEPSPTPKTSGQTGPGQGPEPAPTAAEPSGRTSTEQLSRGAQFAERTRALQQAAGTAQQAAQTERTVAATARGIAATARGAAAVGRGIALLFSPPTWPVWIGVLIAASIFFVVLLVLAAACIPLGTGEGLTEKAALGSAILSLRLALGIDCGGSP